MEIEFPVEVTISKPSLVPTATDVVGKISPDSQSEWIIGTMSSLTKMIHVICL